MYALLLMLMAHGSSLSFVTAADSVLIPTTSSLNLGSCSYSIEFWFKNIGTTGNHTYFTKVAATNSPFNASNAGIGCWYRPTWTPKEIQFCRGNGGAYAPARTYTPCSLNTWYHVVYTYNIADDSQKVYLNGTYNDINAVKTSGSNAIYSDTFRVKLGSSSAGSYFVNGFMKGLRVYKRILLTTEATWNYNHPEKIYSTDSLKLWLPLSEYTGTVAGDSSGNANNGTISGATWNLDTPVFGARCVKE